MTKAHAYAGYESTLLFGCGKTLTYVQGLVGKGS